KVFPSGSIRDRSTISSDSLSSHSALQPHNLVDCLSLCSTGRIWCHFEKHLVSHCRR
uniref:Uncharacterized protein n=1 Tax=Aegilops tauschii subsp. strangulata TaxID=200361 RepID=A0A453STH7_AEGTS